MSTTKALLLIGGAGWMAYLLVTNANRDKQLKDLNVRIASMEQAAKAIPAKYVAPVLETDSQLIPDKVLAVFDTSANATYSKSINDWG